MTIGVVPPPGATVRVKRNDANVPVGSAGVVAYIHDVTGLPVVLTSSGRPVSLLPARMEIVTMPALNVVTDTANPNGAREPLFSWKVFDPREDFVAITTSAIRLSASVAEHFAGVRKVELLYDPERGAVGIRKAAASSGRALTLSQSASGLTCSSKQFLSMLDLDRLPGNSHRFKAKWDAAKELLVVTGVPFRSAS